MQSFQKTLIKSDKWQWYNRGKIIIKHAERATELICLCIFPSVSFFFFYDSALMHSVTFTSGVLHWTRVTVSDIYVPPRKIWVDACSPKQSLDPLFFFSLHLHESKAWFMEAIRSIGCKNPLTSTQVILFVVRMWLKHHLLSLKSRYRGRLGPEPVFSERFCPRKKKIKKRVKSLPTFKPLRD